MKYEIAYKSPVRSLDELLFVRGIENRDLFINPTKDCELDAFKLGPMLQAVEEVGSNLDKHFGLLVDCDCDGITSAAILYQYLKLIQPDISIKYYIHSGKQHGLEDIMDQINDDIDIMLIPDASSNDFKYHQNLAERQIKTIVLDHHIAPAVSEFALVVNNQLADEYANKTLSGAGVVYKFCEAFDTRFGYNFASRFIDLAAVGIIGDMMETTELETRYIISKGLSEINNELIGAIIEKQSYSIGNGPLTPMAISFYVVPLINALIRVGTEHEKEVLFEAFIDGTRSVQSTKRGSKPGQMEMLSTQATRNCINARSRQNRAKEKAMDIVDMIIDKEGLHDNSLLIIDMTDYDIDTTLTGLIAMQAVSKYHKPVLIVRETDVIINIDEDGKQTWDKFYRGSGRCPDKTDLTSLKKFLDESHLCEYAEGHDMAFGVSIPINNLDKLIEYSNNHLSNINFNEGKYEIDFLFHDDDTDVPQIVTEVATNGKIWGKGNEEPYIVIENIKLRDYSILGTNKDTLKFSVCGIEAIAFKAEKLIEALQSAKEVNLTILGRAAMNYFAGRETPQLLIEDYNISDSYFDF